MKQPYRHRVNEREFLNLPGFHEGAYVLAYVEDTSERGLERCGHAANLHNPHPRMLLQIADCEAHISLEFDLSSPHRRMNSFHKIQTLIAALEAFKAGMAEESALYKRREREFSGVVKRHIPGQHEEATPIPREHPEAADHAVDVEESSGRASATHQP